MHGDRYSGVAERPLGPVRLVAVRSPFCEKVFRVGAALPPDFHHDLGEAAPVVGVGRRMHRPGRGGNQCVPNRSSSSSFGGRGGEQMSAADHLARAENSFRESQFRGPHEFRDLVLALPQERSGSICPERGLNETGPCFQVTFGAT